MENDLKGNEGLNPIKTQLIKKTDSLLRLISKYSNIQAEIVIERTCESTLMLILLKSFNINDVTINQM